MFRTTIIALLISILLVSCDKKEDPPTGGLKLLEKHPVNINQPSGLSRSHMSDHLYTVSNKSGNVYLINMGGQIAQTLNVEGADLEGIEFVLKTASLYLLEEGQKKVVRVSQNGTQLASFSLDIPVTSENDGPEGIAFNPQQDHFYIVNEKNPSRLYVYDLNFNPIADYPLDFARDYSSVDYDPVHNKLWILSDQSGTLTRCDLTGKKEITYTTGVPKGEGVVVDIQSERVYIICDETSQLFIFSLTQ
jgi:uncharacterized protein YjiK